MKKEVFIFLLFFSLIIGLGAVSASENVSDTYAIEEYSNFEGIPVVEDNIDIGSGNAADANENISYCDDYSNNGLSLNGGTFEDIQAVINNASDGDTIELNGTYVSIGNAITVSKNLTIIGSENDVLDRFYQTARLLSPEFIVRLTADCPCFDAVHEYQDLQPK